MNCRLETLEMDMPARHAGEAGGQVNTCPTPRLGEECVVICDAVLLWLRFVGIRTSKRRILRLMRAYGLLSPHRVARPYGPQAHERQNTTERINEMWGTDMTSTEQPGRIRLVSF